MYRPLVRHMKGVRLDTYIDGFMKNEFEDCISLYQIDSINRLSVSVQIEQDVYLLDHPEVSAMLSIILGKVYQDRGEQMIKVLASYLVKPASELDEKIRRVLKLPPCGPYQLEPKDMDLDEEGLKADLMNIRLKHYPPSELDIHTSEASTPNTLSSSFISCLTSATTPCTPPEPEPEPEQTMSQIIYIMITNTLEKAMLLGVTDNDIKYDAAYVELMKAVEEAMEIPVKEIREDIFNLYQSAYKAFEYNIMAKERMRQAIAWENRMRKKLKRLLRRQKNFKGYETPKPTKSSGEISSHPSYKIPPYRPCVCHPKWTFNRYPKDRYGIYLASAKQFDDYSITVSPNINDMDAERKCDDEVDSTLTSFT